MSSGREMAVILRHETFYVLGLHLTLVRKSLSYRISCASRVQKSGDKLNNNGTETIPFPYWHWDRCVSSQPCSSYPAPRAHAKSLGSKDIHPSRVASSMQETAAH